MCGRYYVDDDTAREMEKVIRDVNDKLYHENRKKDCTTKDIYPTNSALTVWMEHNEIRMDEQIWGYPGINQKGLIINARSETVTEKRMFRDSIINRRIIIPAAGFYEWNDLKDQYVFRPLKGKLLMLAGCYQQFDGQNRFVILTTKANDSMEKIHHRMPIIIQPEDLVSWLSDDKCADAILRQVPPSLTVEATGQMSLFD